MESKKQHLNYFTLNESYSIVISRALQEKAQFDKGQILFQKKEKKLAN